MNASVRLAFWKARFTRALGRLWGGEHSTNAVWLPSFIALGAADAASSSAKMRRSFRGLSVLGAVGGLGLLAASTRDLHKAKTPEQRLDAASDLAWGAQGILYLTKSWAAMRAGTLLGLIGAATQTLVGVHRIRLGLERRDLPTIALGALDVAGGCLWLGWDVAGFGQPSYVITYIALMVGREAYANREALRALIWPFEVRVRVIQGRAPHLLLE